MQTEQTDFDAALSNDSVLDYLARHPEFFVNNKDILPRLRIPHETGGAVSLIEKQVSVLRGKCGHLENSLRDFIAVARENENLHQRLHGLIQDVISASGLDDVVPLIQSSLRENFYADQVHVLLIAAPPKKAARRKRGESSSAAGQSAGATPAISTALSAYGQSVAGDCARTIRHNDKNIKLFKSLFETGQTLCGIPGKDQLDFIVGRDHSQVASAAMIPLHFERKLGVITLTSADEARFAAGKGVMFLNQLGDLLSRRIHSYGQITKAAVK